MTSRSDMHKCDMLSYFRPKSRRESTFQPNEIHREGSPFTLCPCPSCPGRDFLIKQRDQDRNLNNQNPSQNSTKSGYLGKKETWGKTNEDFILNRHFRDNITTLNTGTIPYKFKGLPIKFETTGPDTTNINIGQLTIETTNPFSILRAQAIPLDKTLQVLQTIDSNDIRQPTGKGCECCREEEDY